MQELMMICNGRALVPATEHDYVLMRANYKIGQAVKTECKKQTERSLQHHKLYFGGLIGLVKDYWDGEDAQLTTKNEQAIANMFCGFLQSKGISVDAANNLIDEFLQSISDRRAEKYTPLPPTTNDIHEWIKTKAKLFDLVPQPDGTVICKTKSISFAKMSQEKFDEFYKAAFNVCWRFVLARYFDNEADANNAINRMLDMAA